MSDAKSCKNCHENIVQILTTDGIGWYHTTDRPSRVIESCYPPEPFPVAEPA